MGRDRLLAQLSLLLVAIAIAAGAVRLVGWSLTQQVSFDGAMNLEVARSLAEGNGYERLYAGRSGFSHEIQSRAPFIVPAAAVFAAFGVGVWQSQLTNLLYLLAFAGVVFCLVRRAASWRWGLAAVAVCLWTPGIREIAMNGYGEVPALTWWLAAVLVLLRPDDAPAGAARMFLAGLLLGMAVLTKTVLAIGVVAIVPLVLAALPKGAGRVRGTLSALAALVVGVALPACAYELAHVLVLGDVGRWQSWFSDELHAIRMQSGAEAGFKDTHGLGAKLIAHSAVLADWVGLPLPWLAFWIGGPIALVLFARRAFASPRVRATVLVLAFFAGIYFLWWLGFTPTEKAWYRRVFNGVLVLDIIVVLALAWLWTTWRSRAGRVRLMAAGGAVAIAVLQGVLIVSNVSYDDSPDVATAAALSADLAALAQVPRGAPLYGVGWYSAPEIALYSGRRLANIVTRTPAELAAESPVFLVLGAQAQITDTAAYWLDRYANRDLARSATLRLVELDVRKLRDPFAGVHVDPNALLDRVDFHRDDYPYLFGFHGREGNGWRWASADAEILLRYGGEREFNLDVYVPSLDGYRLDRDVGVAVWVNGCRLGRFRFDDDGRARWWLPAANCPLSAGQVVAVRLVGDNVYASRDGRSLAYILHGLGFADPQTAQR